MATEEDVLILINLSQRWLRLKGKGLKMERNLGEWSYKVIAA